MRTSVKHVEQRTWHAMARHWSPKMREQLRESKQERARREFAQIFSPALDTQPNVREVDGKQSQI